MSEEALVSLSERTILCPIETFKFSLVYPTLRFGLLASHGPVQRYTCCVAPDNFPRLTRPKTPVLFNLLGQISVEDCYMTKRGRLRRSDGKPVASCWLQQRPGPVSDRIWRGVTTTIDALVNQYAIGTHVDTSKLLDVGPDGKLRLQVIWEGGVTESGQNLPMFDEFGNGEVPASISEVPFGQPVHAVFSIDFVRDRGAGTRTIVASLFALIKA